MSGAELLALADRISVPLWDMIVREGWSGVPKLKADAREALGYPRAAGGGSFAELANALREKARASSSKEG